MARVYIKDGRGSSRDERAGFVHNRPVHLWRITNDPKVGYKQHTVPSGFGHALLAPTVSHIFELLRVQAAIWEHGLEWMPLHDVPSVAAFELEHGKERERDQYNGRQLREVLRRKATVRGEHAGCADLFVPIVARGGVLAVLVTGPFMLARPSATQILERWRRLTGRQAHPADPEFASYLIATFSSLVLDGDKADVFAKLLGCLTQLLIGEGPADRLANEAEGLRVQLEKARFVDRMWEEVQSIVDDRSARAWQSVVKAAHLRYLGLPRTADGVLVGLTVSRGSSDPVDEAVRRDAFQRASVGLAGAVGGAIAGRVGEHGIVFLCGTQGGLQKKRQMLLSLAERASILAGRDYGLSLHFGASIAVGSMPLSKSYQAALGAAERALAQQRAMVTADATVKPSTHPLRHLRQELARIVKERPDRLGAHFDRYLEAVAAQCAHRMDPARGHLDAGFEQMAAPLVGSGVLDERSFDSLCVTLDRAAGEAHTLADLFAAYRRAVADVSEAALRPVAARQDRSLQRAIDHIRKHFDEPLRRDTVAAVAGLAPDYFSRLFKARERTTFEGYVLALRIERAKQLLANTGFSVARVAEMSGYRSPEYFSRVFRRATGTTPLGHRRTPAPRRSQKRS
jgi:AraC-like DNA-binding protein